MGQSRGGEARRRLVDGSDGLAKDRVEGWGQMVGRVARRHTFGSRGLWCEVAAGGVACFTTA